MDQSCLFIFCFDFFLHLFYFLGGCVSSQATQFLELAIDCSDASQPVQIHFLTCLLNQPLTFWITVYLLSSPEFQEPEDSLYALKPKDHFQIAHPQPFTLSPFPSLGNHSKGSCPFPLGQRASRPPCHFLVDSVPLASGEQLPVIFLRHPLLCVCVMHRVILKCTACVHTQPCRAWTTGSERTDAVRRRRSRLSLFGTVACKL